LVNTAGGVDGSKLAREYAAVRIRKRSRAAHRAIRRCTAQRIGGDER
jgi:hypothetical protein